MNPEWVVAHLTETKGIPLSAEVQRAFVDNSVDAATAKLLDISSLEELGITSSLTRARVLAALQLLSPLSQDRAPSAPAFDDGSFGPDQPLPTAIANPVFPAFGSGYISIVEATPVFESSVATAVVVTEGDAKERGRR